MCNGEMADAAVGWAINKLDILLTGELNLLACVNREFEDVKDELETIKAFLEDADGRVYQETVDNGNKTWVAQVREIAFRIEDVIDEYMLHVGYYEERQGCLRKSTGIVKMLWARRGIASKIQDIKRRVTEIRQRSNRYSFGSSSEQGSNHKDSSWHDPRIHSLFIEETELVGIEFPRAELINSLVEGASENVAISVVGMGGLGKTTLAKKVYDSKSVTFHFDCKAWITVSQSYKGEDILKTLIQQFTRETMPLAFEGIEKMIKFLREYLSEKSYLVIFDDVWEVEFWEFIKIALPDNGKGNRVIVTTRNENVAPSPNESSSYYVFRLQRLPEKDAFELFCKKVFRSNCGNCPSELQELSRAIVEKCEGLPLAIVIIGGVLATKKKCVLEWKRFSDSLRSSLASDQRLSRITKILSLSYHDLPYYLKSCFLFLSLFPEDYSISCWRLIQLWIAVGFIKGRHGIPVEEVAEECLTELIQRNLVQVERVSIHGKARECRVHDLVWEMMLDRSRELSFHQVPTEHYQTLKGRSRHFLINDEVKHISDSTSNCRAHSLILYRVNKLTKSLITSLVENSKLLRILDFEGAPLDYIPDELGNLWLLKYLSLKMTNVKKLPKSIGKLCNLETLDLRQSPVCDLPSEINRLLKLRHLLAYFCNYDDNDYGPNFRRGMRLNGDIGCLQALEKLNDIEVDHDAAIINQVKKLRQLRKLRIKKLRKEHGPALSSALQTLDCLQTLGVSSVHKDEILDLQSLSNPPRQLQHLYLLGRLVNLPLWILDLQGLVKVNLSWSKLGDEAIEVLQALPNLLYLWLYEGYEGNRLHFRKGWFPELKVLHLEFLTELNTLTIDNGALPKVEELFLGPFPKLIEAPSGINFLRNVKRLELVDIQKEIAIEMQPDGGRNYWKVEHIPLVLFFYKSTGFRFSCYKIGDLDLLKCLKYVSR